MEKAILIDGELYDGETGELINQVEQVEVEVIEDNLPNIICNGGTHIQTNTEQLKRELTKYLEKYDVEVTEETEKDCSKMATELNKLAGNLDKKRKETASIIKKPADDLKIAIDELISIIQEKRTNILNGVEVFKQNRFTSIRTLLKYKIEEFYKEFKVSEKYQVCNIEPLVLEGSLAKTNLSKSAIESLKSMVQKVKILEDTVTIREMQLELKCDKAGLLTLIELDEVKHIIEDSDYDLKLDDMILKRVETQEKIKKQIEEQKAKEEEILRQNEIKKQNEALEFEERKKAFEEQKKQNELKKVEEVQKETGKKIIEFKAIFKVEVNIDVDDEKVFDKFFKSLKEQYPNTFNILFKMEV